MSANAAQAASAAAKLPKVLRIGVVVDGKIAQERLIRIGETVTVGESNRNTFLMSGTQIGERHEIFIARQDAYILSVPEWVEGKISWKDGIRGLDELRGRGEGVRKGDVWQYNLNENVRGKVNVGPYTLLFQFVPPPPEPIRQVSAADFKPKMFDGDDPLFHGLLGVFTLIASTFMVWVWTTPLPEQSPEDLIEDATALVVERRIEAIVEPQEVEVADDEVDDKPEQKKDEKPTEETKTEDAPKEQAAPAQKQEVSRDSVAKKSLLIQMLGSAGATGGASGAVADIIGDDSASMAGLDQALAGVSGAQAAQSGATGGVKGGTAGGREDAKVGVGVVTGGKTSTGTGAAVTIKKPVVDVSASVDADVAEGDAGSIASVVKKSSGRIASCVDQALKANPDLNGRVSVGWTIEAGKVTSAKLVKNTTGDAALGECVVRAVRGFRFDAALTAEVSEYPWVVSGQ